MKLIKALSNKNKLARGIKDIQKRITEHNSFIAGNSPVYSIDEQMKQLNQNINELIEVKSSIARANIQVIESVYRLSELKSLASFLKKLIIKEGKVKEQSYNSDVNEWECELSNTDRDKLVEKLEQEIDELQMKMDRYNYETDI